MTAVLRVLVFAALGSLTVQILLYGSRIKGDAVGKPPIAWPALALAKISMGVSLLLLFWKAARGGVQLSPAATVIVMGLLLGGTAIFMFALAALGANLRMGLPKEETALVTSGLYRLSRNPLYLALFCFLGASLIYAFSWVNLAAAAIAVVFHHRIVLAEEKYLANRFSDYRAYCMRVRRYL
jgi:protein-S-isoprenylcysteine O-methyltransferase Ste14